MDDAGGAASASRSCWGRTLDHKPGLTVVEIMDAACDGKIRGMYIMGENPAMSDPDATTRAKALAKLEHLVVQDIFLTETAYLADVVLPATAWPEKNGTVTNTDRMVQLGRRALDVPGEARQDLWIIQRAREAPRAAVGTTAGPKAVFETGDAQCHELDRRHLVGAPGGASAVTYPCANEGDPGQSGRVHRELPDDGRPRQVRAGGHHSRQRAARRRVSVGAHHRPAARALAHRRDDAPRRGARRDRARGGRRRCIRSTSTRSARSRATSSRRVAPRRDLAHARADDGTPRGAVFIPFAFYEAAANLLTNPALDPFGKIAELKYCAVKVTKGGKLEPLASYGGGQSFTETPAVCD